MDDSGHIYKNKKDDGATDDGDARIYDVCVCVALRVRADRIRSAEGGEVCFRAAKKKEAELLERSRRRRGGVCLGEVACEIWIERWAK